MRPFLLSGSCKKESAEDHAVLIQTALNAINQLKTLCNARVVCIALDGEAKWGKLLLQLTFKQTLSASSPIYPWLSACPLLDLHVSKDDLTCGNVMLEWNVLLDLSGEAATKTFSSLMV